MINDAGREIPENITGLDKVLPYKISEVGIGDKSQPHPKEKQRVTRLSRSLDESIVRSGLKNGDRISFHHHLRLGDRVMEQVLGQLELMGFRDLILCLSSVMGPAADAVFKAVKGGVVRRIETTGLKPPLSGALLKGEIPEPVIFRSHGGRARAIEQGETPIDVAFIAASAADRSGNLTGAEGPNRFGSLGYAIVDGIYASHVIAITDFLSEKELSSVSIPGNQVDELVLVESIGDNEGIIGGSLRLSGRPVEKLIARRTLDLLLAAGAVRNDFSYQAGSGGISLLVSSYLKSYMSEKGIRGSFASGGVTGDLVEMLGMGLFEHLWDVQSFDTIAAGSLEENQLHREMSASLYANPLNPECVAHKLDVMILSATEIDSNFHVNSITGTNGRILGALGGAPDTAYGSRLTVVVMPSFRGRIPTVCERVRTVCTPGVTVDALVTERGVVVNPRREDLLYDLQKQGVPLISMEDLIAKVHRLTGKPEIQKIGDKVVGVVEYRDGTILDCIRR